MRRCIMMPNNVLHPAWKIFPLVAICYIEQFMDVILVEAYCMEWTINLLTF